MRIFYWIVFIIVYIPVRLIFPFKVIGKENLPPKKRMLIVTNHLSWLDVVLIPIAVPGFRYTVSKKENGKNPVASFFLKLLGVVYIDRDNIDISSMRNLVKLLKEDKNIQIFPEGTRNRTGIELQQVKSGAALIALQGGAVVTPIMIAYKPKAFVKNYIYVAPSIKLSEQIERPYNAEKINAATEMLRDNMSNGLDYVREYAENRKRRKHKKNAENNRE